MAFRYFAYGSVLSLAHARDWCASHGLDVGPFLAGVPARLPDHRLVFRVPSRFWQGLVADLEPAPGEEVHGVLFTLGDEVREAVLRKEGVATGLYRERACEVEAEGKRVLASGFEAEPARRAPAGPASGRYLDALVEGAKERGLPAEWVRHLESLGRAEVPPPPPGIALRVNR